MYKYKFIVGFAALVVLQTAFVLYMLQDRLVTTTLEDTDISLQRSVSLIEKSHRLDEFALKEQARAVANRSDLRQALAEEYEGEWRIERHYNVHRYLNRARARFRHEAEDNVDARNLDLDLSRRRPLEHDLFMALDDTGRLISARGSSDVQQRVDDDFSGRFPVVLTAMEEDATIIDMWNWSWHAGEDREFYVVAVAPIRHPDTDEPQGTVVVGNRITDSVAQRRQSLIADGLGADGTEQLSHREQVQTPDLSFFRGDRIYSSTLSSRELSDLASVLFDDRDILNKQEQDLQRILDIELGESNYRAMVRFFPGQLDAEHPAGVVLVTNSDDAIQPHSRARFNILLVSSAILLLGMGFLFFLYHMFVTPFARIEDGIQSIISGDKDHEFDCSKDHAVAENLALHLNLMSAYLQGKPMPDDDVQSLGGWDAFGMEEPGGAESKKPTSVGGVDLMSLGKKKKSDEGGEAGDEDSTPEATTEETT